MPREKEHPDPDMNILLIEACVEDQDLFVQALQRINVGAQYYGVAGCEDALNKLSASVMPRPDFIFLDLDMPVVDGYACLRMMKASSVFKDIPIITYSTPDQVVEITYMLKHGALENLNKSSNFLRLCSDLRTILAPLNKTNIPTSRT